MSHSLNILVWVLLLSVGSVSAANAEDYTRLSNQEMTQLRTQINQMSSADRSSYQHEMQARMKLMNSDELAEFRQNSGISAQTPGYRLNSTSETAAKQSGSGKGKGKGKGKGQGKGKGNGQGKGQGKQLRDGSGSGSGYGRGGHGS